MKKFLLTFVLFIALTTLPIVLMQNIEIYTVIPVYIILGVYFIVGIFAIFKYIDYLYPSPDEINGMKLKYFFESKMFWLAFLIFLSSIVKMIFNYDITEDDIKQIVNLNWTNIVNALFATFLIIIRKIELHQKLK